MSILGTLLNTKQKDTTQKNIERCKSKNYSQLKNVVFIPSSTYNKRIIFKYHSSLIANAMNG